MPSVDVATSYIAADEIMGFKPIEYEYCIAMGTTAEAIYFIYGDGMLFRQKVL